MDHSKYLTNSYPVPRGTKSLQVSLLALGCGLLALALPFLGNAWVYALAGILLVCLVVPAWRDVHRAQFDAFESIHVMGLRYFVYFGLGAVWIYRDPGLAYDRYIIPYLVEAAFYCVIGYLALLACYYGPFWGDKPLPATEERPNSPWFMVIPGSLGIIGALSAAVWAWASWAIVVMPAVFSALSQLEPLWNFSWALCWLLFLSKSGSRRARWIMMAVFGGAAFMILAAMLTDKSVAMTIATIPLIALWYARGKLPWKTLSALLLVLVFLIFPFFNTIRIFDARIPLTTRIAMTTRLIQTWDLDMYTSRSTTNAKGRLAMINSVAVVVRDTPRWVPYAEGRTLFAPAIAYFIPRAIWVDKPKFTLGREFGETFRVLHILDEVSSIASTVPGELYWNFDLPGIIIGMGLWGLTLRFFYRRYGAARGVDPIRRAIHIVLLVQFVHFGGGLAAQSVMVIRTLILIEAYLWLARRLGLVHTEPAGH